jgi:hypothetical protein
MPQSKKYPEVVSFQAPAGTLDTCGDLLVGDESKGDLYREALAREIKRRKRAKK